VSEPVKSVPWGRVALGVAVLAAFFVVGRMAGHLVPAFVGWLQDLGPAGPILFVAGYAIAVVAMLPAVVFTLAGGAIFGLVQGTLYVFSGAVIGSIGAFLVSRYVARATVERWFAGNPRFAAIDRAVGEHGLRIVFLLRLSPAFPFVLLNYLLGLTRVRLRDYALASFGMIPGTLMYVYYGKIAGDVAAFSGGHPAERGAGYYAVAVLGLVATVAVTVVVTRIARRALDESTGGAEA